MSGRYEVLFRPAAVRQIKALDKPTQLKVKDATKALGDNPRPSGCVKMAVGKDLYRLRIGDYRILYVVEDSVLVVTVVKVGNRRDVYRH